MTQSPRTKTRSAKSSKSPARRAEVTVRAETVEHLELMAPAEKSTALWDELDACGAANPELLELIETARGMVSTGELADNSIRTYASLWRGFVTWCAGFGLTSLPASTGTVLLYVAARASEGRSSGTIRSDLSAIRSYHLRAGYTNPGDHEAVALARQGVSRVRAAEGRMMVKAHPLSLDEMIGMVNCLGALRIRPLSLSELKRIRLKAALLNSWFSGRRLDEMARAEMPWLKGRDGVLYLESDHQKRKHSGFATPVERIADERICPYCALQAWLEASAPYRGGVQRLFAMPEISESGEIVLVDRITEVTAKKLATGWPAGDPRYPTRAEFEAKCRAIGLAVATRELRDGLVLWMRLAGVTPQAPDRALRGHSTRRGLITELRAAGVDPRAVADHVGLATIDLVERYSDASSSTNVLDALDL